MADTTPPGELVIELLPARHGDSVLLSWGQDGVSHHLLVDGGPAHAYDKVSHRLSEIPGGRVELFVMTHIDADHVEGSLLLANDAGLGLDLREVWFNGPGQLSDSLGQAHGEMFAALIKARGLDWNTRFGGKAVAADDGEPLPDFELDGGLRLTVLGPDRQALARLEANWVTECAHEGLTYHSGVEALAALKAKKNLNPQQVYLGAPEEPSIYDLARERSAPDTSVSNGSSIVLLAEYEGTSVLLTGDATPTALGRAVDRLLTARGVDRLELDAFKLPHHGSARNSTREILTKVPARRYLFSSSGGRHGRPHPQAVARCLQYGNAGAELVFNYRSPATLFWSTRARDEVTPYTLRYPEPDTEGVSVALPPRTSS